MKTNPNPLLEVLAPPENSESLNPEPLSFSGSAPMRYPILDALKGRSIVYVSDFSPEEVVELCNLASVLESIEVAPFKPLEGHIAITAFFEASTRTRTSFESAVLRLDGKIISIPDGGLTGAKKGESLEDIGEMFNAYGDLVILRHTESSAPERILKNLRVPMINAGNGTGEHPTQALADWYALFKWKPELRNFGPEAPSCNLHLGILGTPGSMRAVKSFILMSLFFKHHLKCITVVSEMADPFGEDLQEAIERAGVDYRVCNDIQDVLSSLDVVYMNSIVHVGDAYRNMDSRFKLNSQSALKEGSVILHPLARLEELDTSLDNSPHNLYWSQAHGAVFVRQALLASIFGRLDRFPREVNFVSEKGGR